MEDLELENYGCILQDIPKDLLAVLQEESQTLEKENNIMTSGLSGSGITKHYYMKDQTKPLFFKFIQSLTDEYLIKFPKYMREFSNLTHDCAFYFDNTWYNMQHKGEFIPNHIHDGILSYSAWLKIPYDVNEELKEGKYASCFEFTYPTTTGNLATTILPISKEWEGKIAIFPSRLMHCVYPFHTVDDVRISLSGNILFDTEKARVY